MDADIYKLYESDFYQILDFKCRCKDCQTSKPEYADNFSISFVRKGNFLFNVFRRELDSYNGCVLLTKPGYEHTVTHTHHVPDECTIFEFRKDFYEQLLQQYGNLSFFSNNDTHSTLIKALAEAEFLHFKVMHLILTNRPSKLQIDSLVIEIIENTLGKIAGYIPGAAIDHRLKRNHLQTIERAKEFIARNFPRDISLADVASNCYVSPFHFSRIFKTFTSCSPHQYLLSVRLKNAELLLKTSAMPVAEVAFASGFNSIEHFTASFKAKYTISPARYRSLQTGVPLDEVWQ